jgi:hypothetical protein
VTHSGSEDEARPGWLVTSPDGAAVQEAPGPVAAEMTAVADNERGGDDGSDRAGAGE